MADNIVGTAFVRIRAITAGVRNDIKRGIDKGVKDAERDTQKSGQKVGDDLGKGINDKLRSTQFSQMLGRSLQNSLRYTQAVARGEGHKVGDNLQNAIREAMRPTIMGRMLQQQIAETLREAARGRAQQAAQQAADQLKNPFEEMLRPSIMGRTFRMQLEEGLRNARAADVESMRLGRHMGDRFGKAFADAVSHARLRNVITTALAALFIPALGGLLKIAGAYVGELVSLFSSLGPAIVGASAVAVGAFSAIAQAMTVLQIAFVREGEALEEFKTGMTELFDDLAEEVQSAMLGRIARSIRTFADVYLPILENTLLGTVDAIGNVTDAFAAMLNQPFFRGQFVSLMESNNRVIELFGAAGVNLAAVLITIANAAAPLTEMFARYVLETTAGWRATIKMAAETGNLAAFMDRAAQSLQQLGRIGENVRRALSETFSAASSTGQTLLDRIEELSARWRAWTESISGQNQMEQFFRSSAVIVAEVNGLIGDMFKALAQGIAENPDGIVAFIRSLRTQALPALIEMGGALAGLGPAVITLVTALSDLIGAMANSGAIGAFTAGLTAMLQAIRDLLALPVVGDIIAWGLAFRALGVAINLITFGAFSKALGSVGTAIGTLITRMGAVRTAAFGMQASLATIASAAAGPLGIALAGLTLGLGFLAMRHQEAKQRAAEQEAELQVLAGTLDQATGAATRATEAAITEGLANEGLLDDIEALGLSRQTIIDVILGQEAAESRLTDAITRSQEAAATDIWDEYGERLEQYGVTRDTILAAIQGNAEAEERLGTIVRSNYGAYDGLGDRITGAQDQHSALTGYVEGAAGAFEEEREQIALTNEEMGNTAAAESLATAIETLRDAAADADDKIRAFQDALSILNGEELSVEQTNRRLHQTFRDVEDALVNTTASAEAGTTIYYDLAGAINQSTGELDTTTEIGGILADTYDRLFDRASETSGAIAAAGGSAAEAQAPFNAMNQEFIDLLETAGATPAQIDAITTALDRTPSTTELELLLDDQATDPLTSAQTLLATVDGTTAIAALVGNDQDLAEKIVVNRDNLTALDQLIATATVNMDDEQARGTYLAVMEILANLDQQNPTPEASLDPRALEQSRTMIVQRLEELAAMRPTPEVRAETSYWQQKKREVDADIAALNAARGIPDIDANTSFYDAKDQTVRLKLTTLNDRRANPTVAVRDQSTGILGTIQSMLNAIRSKTVTVTTINRFQNQMMADGGIVQAANGLVRNAMIASAGSNILWAEPETGGEAYIPFAPSKRRRSTAILQTVANKFGYALTKPVQRMADGGLTDTREENNIVRQTITPTTSIVNNFNLDSAVAAATATGYAREVTKEQRREASVRNRTFSG